MAGPDEAPSRYAAGIQPFRDAAALVRAVAAGDSAGVYAITSGTDAPQHLACAVAAFAYFVGSRSGLDAAGFNRLIREFTGAAIDNVLDQPQQWSGQSRPPQRYQRHDRAAKGVM